METLFIIGLTFLIFGIAGTIYNAIKVKNFSDWRNHLYSSYLGWLGLVLMLIGIIFFKK